MSHQAANRLAAHKDFYKAECSCQRPDGLVNPSTHQPINSSTHELLFYPLETSNFVSMATADTFIHPSAIIDKGAEIGTGTRIWHFSHLMPTCKLGERCNIGQNVYIDNNTVIGNGVKIQNNVSIYNGVIIEDDVFLGPSMVFTNVINPRSFIERKDEFRKTCVRKGATIGANATILCGIEIGPLR